MSDTYKALRALYDACHWVPLNPDALPVEQQIALWDQAKAALETGLELESNGATSGGHPNTRRMKMSDLIERLTRAAAEADGQVWDGLTCKQPYANMVGAVMSELVAVGFIFNAADERDLVIRDLMEKAEAAAKASREIRRDQIRAIPDDGPWQELEDEYYDEGKKLARALTIAAWLKDQLEENK